MRHNRDMHMSVEMITIVLVAVSFVIVLNGIIFAGLAWFLRRMNERFDKADELMDERFKKIHQRFDKLDQRFDELDQGFDELSYKLPAI